MTTVTGQLLEMLETVAEALGSDLRNKMVFIGGCTTAIFITDQVVLDDVRATDDVDLIVDLAGYAEWAKLQKQLRKNGFSDPLTSDFIYRMQLGELKVDFMPDDEKALGFSNRWYRKGIETAVLHHLTPDLNIKHLSSALFIAMKLDAYLGRGHGDIRTSHDMEDILLLVDGREELLAEIKLADPSVRGFIAEEFKNLQKNPEFDELLDGNIRGPEGRIDIVRERFSAISSCDTGG
ncbi:MAG: hypothetical protein ACNYPF_04530 [Candidatus Puniceispirillales bacterium WSBS_2018_MAG_OTU23]